MKTLTLATGEQAIVDDEDFPRVSGYRWKRKKEPSGNIYAASSVPHSRGYGQTTVLLHRIILNAPKGMTVDHRDGDGLNNRRENIRLATDQQNIRSFQRKRKGKTSRYRGVWWSKPQRKWIASIMIREGDGWIRAFRGEFHDEHQAALAFNEHALRLGFSPEALNKVEVA